MSRSPRTASVPLDGGAPHFLAGFLVQPARPPPKVLTGRIQFRRGGIFPVAVGVNRRQGRTGYGGLLRINPCWIGHAKRGLDSIRIHTVGGVKPGIVGITTCAVPTYW